MPPILSSDAVSDSDPVDPAPPTRRHRGRAARLVSSLTRRERRRREQIRGLKRLGPAAIVALVLHGVALWYLWNLAVAPPDDGRALLIEAHLIEDETTEFEELPPEPEELEPIDEVVDPVVSEFDPAPDDVLVDSPRDPLLGLGGAGGGRGVRGRRGGDLLERFEDVTGGGDQGTAFGDYVSSIRERGLDVVFVVDATASMGRFLDQARRTIDEIIDDVSEVVPTQRLGMVAYRDVGEAFLTRHVDLTDDRYRVQSFLLDLSPVGGGDFEEAVDAGLAVAFDELSWRPSSKRVVIVVGDAPVHDEDEQPMLNDVRSFLRGHDASLSVLYTGTDPDIRETQRDRDTRRAFEKLANTGRGFMSELTDDAAVLRANVLEMSFGRRWFEDVERLLSLREVDRKQRILRDKLEREDRDWFVRQLARDPLPAVVDACLTLWDRSIAEAAFELLIDDGAPSRERYAALYVIKRKLDPDAQIDVDAPLEEQQGMVDRLRRAVAKVPAAAPAPPTPGASSRPSEG